MYGRYTKRREELEAKMQGDCSELDAYEFETRAYICKSILDALTYVIEGKGNNE